MGLEFSDFDFHFIKIKFEIPILKGQSLMNFFIRYNRETTKNSSHSMEAAVSKFNTGALVRSM